MKTVIISLGGTGMPDQILLKKRETYINNLSEALDRILAQLSKNPKVHKVILFGSYATGRRDLLTDIDMLVVMDSSLDYVDRTAKLYSSLQAGVDLDLFVYTPEEYEEMRQKPFLKNALVQGKVLYEKRKSN
jgi:predicted nucleotidyltransferase